MQTMALSEVLEREHRDIDGGIEEYSAGLTHGDTDTTPLLRAMNGLRRHIYLEEEFLFPHLKNAGLAMPIFVMMREHGELWDAMETLDTLLADNTDTGTLQSACRELLAKLDNHNSKEEPIIYPQADTVLDDAATEKLHDYLNTGRMPHGWRCEKATSVTA
ncbi:MAG: hemerythrin domain-containing protein [Cryobacterium sp.]|nr:hemerythrin domain-containing protein [Micrococcales bacterium]MBX3079107.1 hemerythrin domain-containing protein [Cryobacterium sp.]MBX3310146.1 hemerythrin domain-containing protein [Cryobacterium sp.]HNP15470.1 hemerythrin domain-containing protein [Terrimesophilobacter sp.]